jgi:NADH dehydrogenase [ubiquinone] 1 alpha subcomplex assembly factor 7
MFGEILGLCLAQTWLDQGAPAAFTLAELGPGRGTLMADILRATRSVPNFHAALSVHLVEASETLKAVQAQTLAAYLVTWHSEADTLPSQPLFLVANEFFDALPIRQFIRHGHGWAERLVGVTNDALAFGLSAPAHVPSLAHRLENTNDGDLVELCPAAQPVMATIEARIVQFGGVALIIDYGDWRSLGDTLQALRAHAPDPVLAHPGAADLTAHVDFESLARAAPRLSHSQLTPQGVLLERLGITARATALAQKLSGASLNTHIAAHRRLTHPEEMGNLFKTLALVAPSAPTPPGFAL